MKKVSLIYEYRVEEKCGILLQLYTLVLVFPAEAVSDFSSSWWTHGARASLVCFGSLFGLHLSLLFWRCPWSVWWHEKVLFSHSARTHGVYGPAWKQVGGWLLWEVCRVSSTEKLLDEETNATCYSRPFKNQSCSSRNLNNLQSTLMSFSLLQSEILPAAPCFCHFPRNLGINSQLIYRSSGKGVLIRWAGGWTQLSAIQRCNTSTQEHFSWIKITFVG